MARSEPQINLRIPAELKDALEQAAFESKRSLTAEVVARLESSFAARGSWATTFPSAAAVAGGAPSGVPDAATAVMLRMEQDARIDRVRDLEFQRVQLNTQVFHLVRDMNEVGDQMDAAKKAKSPELPKLRERFKALVDMTADLDAKLKDIDVAIKNAKSHVWK